MTQGARGWHSRYCPRTPTACIGEAPRDLRPTWFSHPPTVDFEDLTGWTCSFYPPGAGRFMRSRAMPLAGEHTGRLDYSCPQDIGWALLKPPAPIVVREPFDHVQMWVCGFARDLGFWPVVVLKDAAGKYRRVWMGTAYWPDWSIADVAVREPIATPATVVGLEVWNLRTPGKDARSVYFDNLAFYREAQHPIKLSMPPASALPCAKLPVREESIVPTPAPGTTATAARAANVSRFTISSRGETIEYRYEPKTGTLDDLTVTTGGATFKPCAGGGPRPLTGKASYMMSFIGGSLVIDVQGGPVESFEAGRPPDDAGFKPLAVPYLTYGPGGTPVMVRSDGLFGSWLWDYYRSDASRLSNTAAEYLPLTDGRRNPLRDRLVLTFSRKLEDVLPNIPNPKATQAPNAIEDIYCALQESSSRATEVLGFWQQMKRYGVDHLIAKQHAEIWSPGSGTGMVPFFQNPRASSAIEGGDRALREYIAKVKALGYRYALYTDYVLTTPVEEQWNEDDVARYSGGDWIRNWYQAFTLTPLRSWERAAHYAPLIARFGNNASYCDQHTSTPVWNKTDYDARKPLAGMFRPIIYAYAAVFEAERRAYKGPVFSEGDHHWMMAGLCDGSYAQFHPDDRPAYKAPMLVDFDLRKMHPLEMDLGMGWQETYGLPGGFDPTGAANDRLLAATLAFGHAGLLYQPWNAPSSPFGANPLGAYRDVTLRTYFMTQQAQKRYLMQPVAQIEYHDGSRYVDAAEAISSGAIETSRVHVVYRNGLEVWVNGGFDDNWDAETPAGRFVLPPAGYAVWQKGQMLEYSALVDGHRVDLAVTPEYVYADARGQATQLGPMRLSGAAVLRPDRAGLRAIGLTPGESISVNVRALPFAVPKAGKIAVHWEDDAGPHDREEPLAVATALAHLKFE